jgi:CBS domain containing-hemolysin-like protein
MSTLVGLLVVILLLAASAFFVAVEFSLVAADRSRLEAEAEHGSWPASAAVAALRRLSFHLSGAQLGISMVSLVLGFLAEPLVAKLIDPAVAPVIGSTDSTVSLVLALVLATVAQMVVGELVPKNVAISHPDRTAMALAPVARVVHGSLSLVILVFNGAANWAVRRFGIEPQEEMHHHRSLEELEYLIRSSGDSGALDPDAHELLTRTLRFGDKTAADALTPRVHVNALPTTATLADLVEEVSRSRHSRYPVYAGDLDHLRGVVEITAVFDVGTDDRARVPVTAVMREPLVVPETRDLIDILDDFRSTDRQLAVVIDEHGGTAGLLTLEDVLEEIVGDVDDEHDLSHNHLTAGVAEGVYVVAGTLHPDEVRETSGFEVPDGPYETVAGFVLERLGRIPVAGDGIRHSGWCLEVAEMDGLRIASVQLIAPDNPSAGPPAATDEPR